MVTVGSAVTLYFSDGTPHDATVIDFDVDNWLGRNYDIIWVQFDDEPWQKEWLDIEEFERMLNPKYISG